jgi:hypothetical protein
MRSKSGRQVFNISLAVLIQNISTRRWVVLWVLWDLFRRFTIWDLLFFKTVEKMYITNSSNN